MEKIPELAALVLAVLGFVAWLGGGRKWAFRTLLATLILAVIGVIGTILYLYGSDRAVARRAKQIHECAIAKVVNARCVDVPGDAISGRVPDTIECPTYFIGDGATRQQEEEAVESATKECTAEVDPSQQSLHEEIVRFKREHGVKGDYNDSAKGWTVLKIRLNDKACADKIRKTYPRAYDDVSDSVLAQRTLAKYPNYCDVQ